MLPSRARRGPSSSRSGPISASTDLAVVVLDALAAPRDEQLRAALGPELDDHLRHMLRERALSWARVAGGGAEPRTVRRAQEVAGALGDHAGPVVLVAPDVPGLGPHHLSGALDDLADGVLLTLAPANDGRPFILALARPEPDLLALATGTFDELAAGAAARGGALGLLRPERRLATLADARAVAADPTAPSELRDLARLAAR